MAISLNEIVSILSDRVGKPFNVALQAELKKIINYKRANYLQQLIEKHPEQRRFFTQEFVAELVKVPQTREICGSLCSTKDCPVLMTDCEVPRPLRNSQTLFDFVGSGNFLEAYGEMKPEFLEFNKYNKYTNQHPKWFYIDGRIVIYKDLTTKYVGVRGVFADPEEVNSCNCEDAKCYSDDSPYPAPEDLINAIMRDTLSVELRAQFPDIGEVTVDDKPLQEPTGK